MTTILMCGLTCVAGSLIFAGLLPGLRRAVRPIYVRAGILAEAAEDRPAVIDEIRPFELPATIPISVAVSAESPAMQRGSVTDVYVAIHLRKGGMP